MLSSVTHLSFLHDCFIALIPDNVSVVAGNIKCFFFLFFFLALVSLRGFVLSIWCLVLGKPQADWFCLNLLLRGVDAAGFCLEQPSDSQQTPSLKAVYVLCFVWLLE